MKSIQDIKVEFNKEIAQVKKIQILMIAEMKNPINLNLNLNGKHHQQNGPCVRQGIRGGWESREIESVSNGQ